MSRGPFQSVLWPHVDLIRKMRLTRKTWPQIAEELARLGVRQDPWAVRRFFKRCQEGKGKQPLGFAGRAGASEHTIPVRGVPGHAIETLARRPGSVKASDLLKPITKPNGGVFAKYYESMEADIYDEARRAIREEQQAKPRTIKPDQPL